MNKLMAYLLALILLVTMACCLTACDDDQANGTSTTTTTNTTTTTTVTTTTTTTKLQMSDAELRNVFTTLVEKAYRFGFFESVDALSPFSTAPYMNYMEGKVEAYGKASDGVTLYKKTISIEDINAELAALFGSGFDFSGVDEGTGTPATYKYKHEGSNFVYYDLEHNLKLEKYTFKVNNYTANRSSYTVSYTVDYATSADVNGELNVAYAGGSFLILSNTKK